MSTELPHDPVQAAQVVSDLLEVIAYLTHINLDPAQPFRFVSIREDADVSAEVNPAVERAEAYLRAVALTLIG